MNWTQNATLYRFVEIATQWSIDAKESKTRLLNFSSSSEPAYRSFDDWRCLTIGNPSIDWQVVPEMLISSLDAEKRLLERRPRRRAVGEVPSLTKT